MDQFADLVQIAAVLWVIIITLSVLVTAAVGIAAWPILYLISPKIVLVKNAIRPHVSGASAESDDVDARWMAGAGRERRFSKCER